MFKSPNTYGLGSETTGFSHKKYNLCTQMGNQGTASDGLVEGAEFVELVDWVKLSYAWTNRPVWPQALV